MATGNLALLEPADQLARQPFLAGAAADAPLRAAPRVRWALAEARQIVVDFEYWGIDVHSIGQGMVSAQPAADPRNSPCAWACGGRRFARDLSYDYAIAASN